MVSMKRPLIALLLLLSSATAFAAEQAPSIFQISPPQRSRVQTNLGITQIHSRAADIRIAWLPLLAPLPYSYPRSHARDSERAGVDGNTDSAADPNRSAVTYVEGA